MKNKRKFLYIALGVIVLIGMVGIKNSSFLQGKMFRFDEKRILDTQQIDLKESSQKTRLDNSILESNLKEQATKNTLQKIWGIRAKTKTTIPKCSNSKNIIDKLILEQKEEIYKEYIEGVKITFFAPKNITTENIEIKQGITLIRTWLKKAQEYFGPYPCKELIINTYIQEIATGNSGYLNIGGKNGGIDYYILVWHELTHGYFGDSSGTPWLDEGPSLVIPYIMYFDSINTIPWDTWKEENNTSWLYSAPTGSIEDAYKSFITPGWSGYSEGKIYLEKNSCDLQYNIKQEAANWGWVFLLNLTTDFGKKNVIDTLHATYEKYRYTNLTPITDKDFYDAFLYFVAQNNKTAVDQYSKAKTLLKTKLCL